MIDDPLAESAARLFGARVDKAVLRAAEAGVFPQALWDAVTEAGFTAALLPEAAGGFGAATAEAMRLVHVAAEHAAPIPLAETMLAGWMLARAGLAVPEGVLTLAPVRRAEALTLRREGAGWRLSGVATRVPWGRDAAAVLVWADGMIACVSTAGLTIEHGANLAGEPRDRLSFDGAVTEVAPAEMSFETWRAAGAAVRTVQMAGALARVLAMTVGYVQTRVQFGRPIGKFQAIQQNLAVMAGHAAAAVAAADMAIRALDTGLPMLTVGAAKARVGEAASVTAGLAHQAHGAIGFTQEYELHDTTRRLWSWRDEFGNEAEWNAVVGRAALAAGADGLWPALTAVG
jgi:acyl-CoA dehydrogenase